MSKTTIKSFVNQFVALVKGDDSAVVAERVFRKANSALTASLAVAQGDLVTKEESLAEANENLTKARLNYGKEAFDKNEFISNLSAARQRVEDAQEALKAHQEKISILESELDLLKK